MCVYILHGCILKPTNHIFRLIVIISIISLNHLHRGDVNTSILILLQRRLLEQIMSYFFSSPLATSNINHFLPVTNSRHSTPCCISLVSISLSNNESRDSTPEASKHPQYSPNAIVACGVTDYTSFSFSYS